VRFYRYTPGNSAAILLCDEERARSLFDILIFLRRMRDSCAESSTIDSPLKRARCRFPCARGVFAPSPKTPFGSVEENAAENGVQLNLPS